MEMTKVLDYIQVLKPLNVDGKTELSMTFLKHLTK
jgi:hypothetical protein